MRKWILSLLLLAACGDEPHDDAPAHVHRALFGGRLVEVGDHLANIELVHDPKAGTLSLYVLDGHAQHTVRLEAPALQAAVEVGGTSLTLELRAVADPLSGETVGDTARFMARDDALKGAVRFSGRIISIRLMGHTFRDLAFTYDSADE